MYRPGFYSTCLPHGTHAALVADGKVLAFLRPVCGCFHRPHRRDPMPPEKMGNLHGWGSIVPHACRLNWQLHFGEPPKWSPGIKFILVDVEPSSRDAAKAAIVLRGDAGTVAGQLLASFQGSLQIQGWRQQLQEKVTLRDSNLCCTRKCSQHKEREGWLGEARQLIVHGRENIAGPLSTCKHFAEESSCSMPNVAEEEEWRSRIQCPHHLLLLARREINRDRLAESLDRV